MPMSHNNRGDTSGLCAVFVSSISSEIRGIIQYCLETMPCIVPKYLVSLSTNVWPFGGDNAYLCRLLKVKVSLLLVSEIPMVYSRT